MAQTLTMAQQAVTLHVLFASRYCESAGNILELGLPAWNDALRLQAVHGEQRFRVVQPSFPAREEVAGGPSALPTLQGVESFPQ